jgi:hypothetical protein
VTRCGVQASGAIELYFYDELDAVARAVVDDHLRGCAECAHALEELRLIGQALASRPDVSAPQSGDWAPFMARLDAAIHPADTGAHALVHRSAKRGAFVAYLAMAAVLALVTVSVTVALRSRHQQTRQTIASFAGTVGLPSTASGSGKADTTESETADFEALSEQHFERSKLVVLGLATKDPADRRASDWAYERELASSLLKDTRMYRLAAEDRGLTHLAGVMRDLEIVLLQTAMTDETDAGALPQIQRLIQKRDLLEKMDAVGVPATDRAMRTATGTATRTKGL